MAENIELGAGSGGRSSIDSINYSSFSSNIPRHQGPQSVASSSYSNFRKQNTFKYQPSGNSYGNGYGSRNGYFAGSARNAARFFRFKVPVFFKRVLKPPTLDFDKSIWEIFYLIVSPKKVYKSLYYHKYTKNYYHRDDPSFIILISLFLTISAIAWGITYNLKFLGILRLILYMVIVDFYLVGLVVATVNWFLVNKFLAKNKTLYYENEAPGQRTLIEKIKGFFQINSRPGYADETLEWAYCFDIHANSFLVIWINLYLIQFILLPILVLDNFFSRLLGNTLYLATFSYYCLNSFYGYNILTFLFKTEFILLPIPVFIVLWLVMSIGGFSMTKFTVEAYFN